MDKKQILAVILSVIIIIVGMTVQTVLFGPKPSEKPVVAPAAEQQKPTLPETTQSTTLEAAAAPVTADTSAGIVLVDATKAFDAIIPAGTDPVAAAKSVYSNSLIRVEIDPAGAAVTSLKLLKYNDNQVSKEPVEMIVPAAHSGLVMRFGGKSGQIIDAPFYLESQVRPDVFRFYRDFQINSRPGETFRITKTYTFHVDDYLFELEVGFQNSRQSYLPLDSVDGTYTLSLEPQMGPISTANIVQGADFRRFAYLPSSSNDKKVETISPGNSKETREMLKWAAVDSKYFSFFVSPGAAEYTLQMSNIAYDKAKTGSSLFLTRSKIQSDRITDKFVLYAGPKLSSILDNYNSVDDNKAGQSNLNLEKVVDWDWLGWLSDGLKFLMQLFYWLIPNWGVSILLLTLLVKIVLFPLTKKSMESTAKMQALNPRLTELREKYADNPQKMNLEMAELYKKEKINPMGGCLPILIQFPFFIAMYNLFSNHFDLRGAMFLPGWIADLSQPETVIGFSFNFLGFLNVTGLHLLPFIYLGTQLLNGKFTQTSAGQSNGQMKFMMYGMPIMFFFILYEVPSGLLVYWIFQNILNIGQQIYTNKHLARIKESQKNVIPGKFEVVKETKTKSIKKPGK